MDDDDFYDNDVAPIKTPSPSENLEDPEDKGKKEICCIEKGDDLGPGFKTFYVLYRLKQRTSGMVWGMTEGWFSGAAVMGKWGGGGGLLFGALTQLTSIIWGPVIGVTTFGTIGFLSDRYVVAQMVKDYRYSIGAGGYPPVHGTLS